MIFNSRDKNFKSVYGAMETGHECVFRLLLPNVVGAANCSAHMIIHRDGDQSDEVLPLTRTNEVVGNDVFYELKYKAERPGVWWYCFDYEVNGEKKYINRGAFGTGYTDVGDARWQLTVYEQKYEKQNNFKGGIMYQIFPDRFCFSGQKKENVPSDRKIVPWGTPPEWRPNEFGRVLNNDYLGGDLKGIESKLDYIADLGVDILYLNPIFEAHSNHRYNTADYTKIDPLLGTEEDFVSLCNEAHKRGIRVILDGVFSHTGDDSIYFNKYKRYDVNGAYNSKESEFINWYKFDSWPDKYTSWWGIDILPETIEENEDFKNYITGPGGIIEKWLLLGADGWRLDVADELPDSFIEAIRERIEAVKPGALLLGEVWEDASNKEAYGVRRQYLEGTELQSVMNYPFKEAILNFIVNDRAEDFMESILSITENYPKEIVDSLMNLLGTHDTMRIITRLSGETCDYKDRAWQEVYELTDEQRERCIKYFKIAVAIQYTLPGFPSIYYGDEVGMEGCKDPFNRKGYPWNSNEINEDLLEFHKELGRFRRNCPLLKDSKFEPISGSQGCVAYERTDGKDSIIVIANRAESDINYTLPENWTNLSKVLGNGEIEGLSVELKALSFIIIKATKTK